MAKRRVKKEKFNKKLIPLLLMMIIPFIMYYQYIEYDTIITRPYYVTNASYYDLFSFYKTIAIYIVAILCIVFYFLYTKKRNMELKKERIKYYIPAFIYALFIIISTIFAIYPRVAVFGLYERYEGGLALLSYLIFMVYAIETLKEDLDFKTVLNAFLILVFLLSTIGVMQKYIIDIFSIPFFQRIVGIPEGALIESNFHNWSYATLYNPNNLGQFAAMCSPVVLGIIFSLKTIKGRIFGTITFFLSILAGISSASANFTAGIIIALFMFFILYAAHFIPRNKIWRLVLFISISLMIVGFIVGLFAVGDRIWNRLSKVDFISNELAAIKPEEFDIYFNSISITEDTVKFDTTAGVFYLKYMERGISFYDSQMRYIDFEQKGNVINFIEEPYKTQWSVRVTSDNTIEVRAKRSYDYAYIEIVFDSERFLGIRGTGGRILHEIIENQMPPKFRGLETLASRRGYLWFVTASRLDDVFFIGAGPDNYLYWFEQNDVVGKANFLHKTGVLADKPHNWFLQIGSQTGVISLFAFLALVGIYVVSSIGIIGFRRKYSYYEFISSGIMCGVIGYLVSSMFVDSTVGTTPVFYVLMGIGIISNEKLRQIRIKERNLKIKK